MSLRNNIVYIDMRLPYSQAEKNDHMIMMLNRPLASLSVKQVKLRQLWYILTLTHTQIHTYFNAVVKIASF